MLERFLSWLFGARSGRRPGRRRRLSGCLLWVIILIGVLVILSLFFGSYQKGTKAGMPSPFPAREVLTSVTTPGMPLHPQPGANGWRPGGGSRAATFRDWLTRPLGGDA
jgi:hypothetical protein